MNQQSSFQKLDDLHSNGPNVEARQYGQPAQQFNLPQTGEHYVPTYQHNWRYAAICTLPG
jgi:hypothetical protein